MVRQTSSQQCVNGIKIKPRAMRLMQRTLLVTLVRDDCHSVRRCPTTYEQAEGPDARSFRSSRPVKPEPDNGGNGTGDKYDVGGYDVIGDWG